MVVVPCVSSGAQGPSPALGTSWPLEPGVLK